MYLKNLKLSNFKNYSAADITFNKKINCFTGDNGAGKTNILEALYYLSFCKSYFTSSDTQNIKHGSGFFAIHGTYINKDNSEDKVSVIQKKGKKKQVKFNGKEYAKLAGHIGKIPLVMVSPYDRDLINDGSEIRRKYIDGVISQFDKIYLNNLLEYNKALQQRNRLLKYFGENGIFDVTSLSVWDNALISRGIDLYEKRKKFLAEFNPLFEEYYRYLSDGNEKVKIEYVSQLHNENFNDLLLKVREKDRVLKYSTAGVHKDDLIFTINGFPVKKFGSQGQQKTFVIAVKLAQFEFTRRKKGFKPVLLFDDIFDKLDDKRVSKIMELTGNDDFGQVFITDTQKERISKMFGNNNIQHKIFSVKNGTVSEI
jgi:DNA replication and repair protein RecF